MQTDHARIAGRVRHTDGNGLRRGDSGRGDRAGLAVGVTRNRVDHRRATRVGRGVVTGLQRDLYRAGIRRTTERRCGRAVDRGQIELVQVVIRRVRGRDVRGCRARVESGVRVQCVTVQV